MRLFIIGLTVLYAAGAVYAQSVMTRSDECVAAADADVYRPAGVEAQDLNAWRAVGENADPIIDVRAGERKDGRKLFNRFSADPATGEVFAAADPCFPAE